jgi:hypothetical protein
VHVTRSGCSGQVSEKLNAQEVPCSLITGGAPFMHSLSQTLEKYATILMCFRLSTELGRALACLSQQHMALDAQSEQPLALISY